MALILQDRVKVNTTTTGAGTVVLANTAPTGYQTFAVIGNANTTYYTIAGQTSAEWEVGIGTYYLANSSLSRDTILSSSAANAAVTFGVGTKDVFVTYPASQSVNEDAANIVTITSLVSSNVLITGGKVNSAALTGGSINNMTIGATTANTGAFTNITATTINSTSTTLLATSGGNVGIGNTSPVLKFNVAGNGYNTRLASADNLYGYNLGRNTSDGLLYFYGDQSGYVGYVFTGVNGELVKISANGNVNVDAGTFFVDATNNLVGINTSAPGGRLASVVNFGNASSTNFLAQANGTALSQTAGYSFRSTFGNTADFAPRRSADIWSGFNAGNWGTEYLAFGVGSNGGSNDVANTTSEKVRISSAGNVGIGNTNPQSLLTVAGQIQSTSTGYKFPDATVQTTAAGLVAGNASIIINNINITANATIAANTNGFSVGPINTANGVSVTIASGSRWVVI